MVFSSTVFVFLFLPLVLALYHGVRPELRNATLLIASLVFYAWGEARFLPLLLASIGCNYVLGLLVERFRGRRPVAAKVAVGLAVVLNLGVLVRFKYATFLADVASSLLRASHASSHPLVVETVALPLGISFFTFHSLSYVIDVYRGKSSAQRNLPLLGVYILLFPQLVAGPIVRYHEIAQQLTARQTRVSDFAAGVERFVLGLGKKVLIANTVAEVADGIFQLPPGQLTAGLAWLGACAYTLQIYYDFSGYSDMAIGLGRLFGFQLPENFNYPYVARSMTEFWQRWHMSLSRFFRDYLYIPLGGNRRGPARMYFNLALVFLLCGLWHGAGWTFIVWGALHGFFLVVERVGLGKLLNRAWSPLRHVYCLLLVIVTWVFFRAKDLSDALSFLRAMLGHGPGDGMAYRPALFLENRRLIAFAIGVVACAPVLPWLAGVWARQPKVRLRLPGEAARVAAVLALLLASALRLSSGTYNPFIYFRF
jgi:alginate O-acetyltransferase complex protein AlgI